MITNVNAKTTNPTSMFGAATLVITSTRPIVPATLALAGQNYPEVEPLLARILEVTPRLVSLDAATLAQEAGAAQAMNTVLLGVLAGATELPFPIDLLRETILESVPPRAHDVNRRAFEAGLAFGRTAVPAASAT